MNDSLGSKRPLIVTIILSGLGLMAVALLLVSQNYEVVQKGKLLPYTDGKIYEVRFFDKFTLYVEPENRVNFNSLNAIVLSGTAFISLAFFRLLSMFGAQRERLLFLLMSIGMLYLAADEFLGIHESLGHNMQFLMKLPFAQRPDDLIIASYLLPTVIFLYAFRHSIFSARRSMIIYAGAVSCFVLAALMDVFALPGEEFLEFMASLLIISGTISLGLFHTTRAVEARSG